MKNIQIEGGQTIFSVSFFISFILLFSLLFLIIFHFHLSLYLFLDTLLNAYGYVLNSESTIFNNKKHISSTLGMYNLVKNIKLTK